MPYIHKIFEKATIRSVVDFLLFGLGPDEDTRDYEERLDELYNKFEEAVRKYDSYQSLHHKTIPFLIFLCFL